MTSCSLPSGKAGCGPRDFRECRSLREMVDLFLAARSGRSEEEAVWWGARYISMPQACRRAMFALGRDGVRDGHQWIYAVDQLRRYGDMLAEHAAVLEASITFEDLYRRVEAILGLDADAKPLLVYDIARRLGYRLGLDPERVYLHAGPKKGADALRRGLGRPRSRALSEFPTSIRKRLTPAQAEDFLCLAHETLRPEHWD